MKKQIFTVLALLSVTITIVTTVFASMIYYNFYKESVKGEIRQMTAGLAEDLEGKDAPLSVLESFPHSLLASRRVTLIAPDGSVVFDTDADTEEMENHGRRDEIIQAQQDGDGEAVRYSATLKKDTYYFAHRMQNGQFLRVSQPMDQMSVIFSATLPVLIGSVILLIFLSLMISSWFTKRMMKPLEAASKQLDQVFDDESYSELYDDLAYDELRPFLGKIHSLNGEIKQYIHTLQKETDTVNTIMRNMHEGLVFLDNDRRIAILNRSAKTMMGVPKEGNYVGQDLIHLSRSQKLLEAVEHCRNHHETVSFTAQGDGCRYHRYFISPVEDEQGFSGTMILVVDITQEHNAEQMRREFTANVSHELKTPLTSISGFAEMMENGMITDEKDIRSSAALIHKESGRMITLVEDIMRLSQIENEGALNNIQPVAMDQVVGQTIRVLEPVADEKNVSLTFEGNPLTIEADEGMMHELVFNLCDNAIKYNRPGGSVTITLQKRAPFGVITVKDTGIGIAQENQKRIFERFYRVDKSRSKQTGGTGLGLSIVKHIVEVHQGIIHVDSHEQEGTTVTVKIPLEHIR